MDDVWRHFDSAADGEGATEDIRCCRHFLHDRDELLQHPGGAEVIVNVDQPDELTARQADALVVVRKVSKVVFVSHMDDARVAERPRHRRRLIGRAIVHDQHFEIAAGLPQDRVDAFGEEVPVGLGPRRHARRYASSEGAQQPMRWS